MKISASSELMKNNKQAEIMSPQKKFQALQTAEGHSLFFSIGTDNVFYLTREVPGSETGWIKTDLSSILSQFNNGIKIVAKTFEVGQNLATNKIDIVLAIQGQDQDYVYTALGLINEDVTWSLQLPWQVQAYDDKANPVSKVVVADLYIASDKTSEYIVADILKDPSGINQFVHRYFLDPSKKLTGDVWNEHDLSADLDAARIQSLLGRKSDQLTDGVYTMGNINGKDELIYMPLFNPFDLNVPGNPSVLNIPQGGSAMATLSKGDGHTALFVAGAGVLYYFPYTKQENGDSGFVILRNDLFKNVEDLNVHSNGQDLYVWGLNKQGQIFYTRCPDGREADMSSWSVPIPILSNVTGISTYLNASTEGNVIFAHQDGRHLVKLIQDPITSAWLRRDITIPSADVYDVLEFNTYTTHVQIEGEDHLPAANQTVSITATSPVSVYINNQFAILSPSNPLEITTDATGTLTLLQQTDSPAAVCYNLTLSGASEAVDVNPMTKMMEILERINSGDDLDKVTVTNADGTTQKLVSKDISAEHKEATAQMLKQFVAASKTVPSNGNIKGRALRATSNLASYRASEFVATETSIWGLTFEGGVVQYVTGIDAMNTFGLRKVEATNKFSMRLESSVLDDIGSAIQSTAGDIFNWLKSGWDNVKNFFIAIIDGAYNFFVKIGDALYTFVMDCYHTIVSAVEFVFNTIKVFIDDLVKWVGFLFKWEDILRTHDVLKNLMIRNMEHWVGQIDTIKATVDGFFDGLEKKVNELAGLENTTGSLSQQSSKIGPVPGKNDPQSNYGVYHLNNGAPSARTNAKIADTLSSGVNNLLQILENAIKQEGDVFEKAFNTLKTQVIDQFSTLDIGTIIKRVLGIMADVLIESAKTIIDAAFDILKLLVTGVVEMLTAKLEIPVLSWLYKNVTGNDLSILDAVCLVTAIPTTLLFKLVTGRTPFPDNAFTTSLIQAKNFDELKAAFQPKAPRANTMRRASARAAAETEPALQSADSQLSASAYDAILGLRFTAMFGSGLLILTSTIKRACPSSFAASALNTLAFYLATAPSLSASLVYNKTQKWYTIMAETIYGITVIQRLADIGTCNAVRPPEGEGPMPQLNGWNTWESCSKGVDCVLGFLSLVPSFAPLENKQDAIAITGAITNGCFSLNRVTTPFTISPLVFGVKMVLIGLYGAGQLALFIETYLEKQASSSNLAPASA